MAVCRTSKYDRAVCRLLDSTALHRTAPHCRLAAMISIPSFSGLSRVIVNANQSGLPSLCVPCLLLLLHPRVFFRLIFVSSSVLFTTSPLITNFPLQTNSNSLVSVMFPGGGKRRISSGAMQCTDYHPRSVSGGFRLKKNNYSRCSIEGGLVYELCLVSQLVRFVLFFYLFC